MPSKKLVQPPRRNRPERDVAEIGRILRRVEDRKKLHERVLETLHRSGALPPFTLRRARVKDIGRHENFGRNLPYYSEIHLALTKFGGSLRNEQVLHVGSSTGIYTRFLQSLGVKAIGLEFDPKYVQAAHAAGNKRQIIADATKPLPLADRSCKVVISDHFLLSGYNPIIEHEMTMLQEIRRVLKPNGILIVSEGYFDPRGLIFPEKVKKMGFEVEAFDPKGSHGNTIYIFRRVAKKKS